VLKVYRGISQKAVDTVWINETVVDHRQRHGRAVA